MSSTEYASDDGEPITENDLFKDRLSAQLGAVRSAGSFATYGYFESFTPPGIIVEGVGSVGIPLSADNARALVGASTRAPFGKGTQTVVDESVRKTWEIDAPKIEFKNNAWKGFLDEVVEMAAQELGVAGGAKNVTAKLHKMLLYEDGAMFKAHRDSEKIPGMFATLVISLPSEHVGGAVRLRHGAEEETYKTSTYSTYGLSYIAWYSDVLHEVEPVESGLRWVLTYNLINTAVSINQSASRLDAQNESLVRILSMWSLLEHIPQYLIWRFDHKYSSKGLRLTHLKGDDYFRALHASQSCERHGGFCLLLANLELRVELSTHDGDDPSEDEIRLSHIVDADGFDLKPGNPLVVSPSGLIQGNINVDRDPDVQTGGEYWGNQNVEIYQFYRESAMVLVPTSEVANVLLGRQANFDRIFNFTARLCDRQKSKPDDSTSRKFLDRVYKRIFYTIDWLDANPNFYRYSPEKHPGKIENALGIAAAIAISLKNLDLLKGSVDRAATGFEPQTYRLLGGMCDSEQEQDLLIISLRKGARLHKTWENIRSFHLGFSEKNPQKTDAARIQHLKQLLDSVLVESLNNFKESAKEDNEAVIDIVRFYKDHLSEESVLWQATRDFVDRFACQQEFSTAIVLKLMDQLQLVLGPKDLYEKLLLRALEPAVSAFDLSIYASFVERQFSVSDSVRRYYERLRATSEELLTEWLEKIRLQANKLGVYHCKGFLMATLKSLLDIMDLSSSQAQLFFQSLIATYAMLNVGYEPKKPTDWARPAEVKQCHRSNCTMCPEVNKFLKDPDMEKLTMAISGDCYLGIFTYLKIDYEGDRKTGSVTFTKTLQTWERDHKDWDEKKRNEIRALKNLPEEKLKLCLADRYDEMMELRTLTCKEDSIESKDTKKRIASESPPQKKGGRRRKN